MTLRSSILFFVLNIALFSGLLQAQSATRAVPGEVVRQFYAFHFASDMGFTEETVKKREVWLAPELLQSIREYFAIEQDPNEPPFINGDPFTGTQEYPNSFKVGPAKISGTSSWVKVTFLWKEAKAPSRTVDVLLRLMEGQWRISDIVFPDHMSMRTLLGMATESLEE